MKLLPINNTVTGCYYYGVDNKILFMSSSSIEVIRDRGYLNEKSINETFHFTIGIHSTV